LLGAVGQIGGTALLLRVIKERNFTLGVAYAKTEALQVALFGFVFLGDPILPAVIVAAVIGTLGVLLMSPIDRNRPLRALLEGWTTRVALYGLACGTCFSFAAVGYRGGALALEGTPFPMAAAFGLIVAQFLQTLLLGGWLLQRNFETIVQVMRAWRTSLFVGFIGAAASTAWFVAMAIEPIAHVRTLALIELLFAYAISRRVFRESLTRTEMIGIVLLAIGLATVALGR
jgi:drug/metabolite transporter (DMT)-like permease